MSLAIAIAALLVAGYAVYSANRARVELAEFAESLEAGDEEEEAPELWLSDGECYAADRDALLAALPGAVALCTYEGVPCAVVPGQGVVSLHKLLTDRPKVAAIK